MTFLVWEGVLMNDNTKAQKDLQAAASAGKSLTISSAAIADDPARLTTTTGGDGSQMEVSHLQETLHSMDPRKFVRKHPAKAIAGAFCIGYLAARRRRSANKHPFWSAAGYLGADFLATFVLAYIAKPSFQEEPKPVESVTNV
jgi:hypothetical protein